MDFHTLVDEQGRLKVTFRLFDAKHEQMPVTGSYTVEVAKPDGGWLCKGAGELAPSDFGDKGVHKAQWLDAGCPKDPGVDELKVNVKLTVKGGAAEKDGKDKDKDAKDSKEKDTVIERSITAAVKTIYERPPQKQPAAGSSSAAAGSGSAAASGSAAGSGSAVAGSGSAASGSGSAASGSGSAATGSAAAGSAAAGNAAKGSASTGSAAVPAEKPATPPTKK
jgi:hypothetical protein